MGITLAQIAQNEDAVSFQFAGESVNVVYYPSYVTEKTFAQLQSFAAMNESTIASNFKALNEILAKLIKSWDVYEDEEQTMYPITPEKLSELPILFRTTVLGAILNNIRPETLAPQESLRN